MLPIIAKFALQKYQLLQKLSCQFLKLLIQNYSAIVPFISQASTLQDMAQCRHKVANPHKQPLNQNVNWIKWLWGSDMHQIYSSLEFYFINKIQS